MKSLLAVMLFVGIIGAASAQDMPVSKTAKHVTVCSVAGDKVDMDLATKKHMYSDYKGGRYFFCCPECSSKFKKDPAKYAKSPHIKIPKK